MLKDGADSVGALGALNRVYLNIGLFSEEWLLHFNAARRRQADLADPDRDGAEELGLLAGDRGADARHGAVLPEAGTDPHYLKDAPGGAGLPDRRRGDARRAARSSSPRPARAATRASCRRCRPASTSRTAQRPGLSRSAGTATGTWTKTDEFKAQMRADRARRPTSSTTTTCRPSCACRSRCSAPTPAARSRPTRSRGNIWDNFSSRVLQGPAVGRHDHGPPPVHRRADATIAMPAGGRGYTRPAVAGQPLVDRAVPAEQHGRPVRIRARRSRRGCGRSRTRSSRCCGRRRREKDPLFGSDNGPASASSIASPSTATSRCRSRTSPRRCGRCVRLSRRLFPFIGGEGGIVQIGPFPKGMPIGLSRTSTCWAKTCRRPSSEAHRERAAEPGQAGAARAEGADRLRRRAQRPGRRHARAQQVQGSRRQQGPLLRHRLLQGRDAGSSDADKRALIAF